MEGHQDEEPAEHGLVQVFNHVRAGEEDAGKGVSFLQDDVLGCVRVLVPAADDLGKALAQYTVRLVEHQNRADGTHCADIPVSLEQPAVPDASFPYVDAVELRCIRNQEIPSALAGDLSDKFGLTRPRRTVQEGGNAGAEVIGAEGLDNPVVFQLAAGIPQMLDANGVAFGVEERLLLDAVGRGVGAELG